MTKIFNSQRVIRIQGGLLLIEALFMLLPIIVALIFKENTVSAILKSSLLTGGVGLVCYLVGNSKNKTLGTRESYLIVTISWIVFSLFGMLPFIFSGTINNFTDAYFETISGITTTGSSILTDVEALPKSIHLWRSLIQWLGGMGVIALYFALLPSLSAGIKPFFAELPGSTILKLQPRIKNITRMLWVIYMIVTALAILSLYIAGMEPFDAVCHALTTTASGGFSTHQDNIAHWDIPAVHYVIIFFMLLAGTNMSLIYLAINKRDIKQFFHDEEFRSYGYIVLDATLIVVISRMISSAALSFSSAEEIIRTSLFQITSVVTTTGFNMTDYTSWASYTHIIFILLIFIGSCAHSTGGGIKIVRFVVVVKSAYYQLKRLIHPKAVIPVRINNQVIHEQPINSIIALVTIYIGILFVSTLILSFCGLDMRVAAEAAMTSLSNLRFSTVDSMTTFASFPVFAKWFISLLMLLGRLEFFTILLILSPAFWKN